MCNVRYSGKTDFPNTVEIHGSGPAEKKKKEKNSSTSFCQSAEFKLLAQGVSMPISNFMGELIDLLGAYGMYTLEY